MKLLGRERERVRKNVREQKREREIERERERVVPAFLRRKSWPSMRKRVFVVDDYENLPSKVCRAVVAAVVVVVVVVVRQKTV